MPRRDPTSNRSRRSGAAAKDSLDDFPADDEAAVEGPAELEPKPLGNGWTKIEIAPEGQEAILRELNFGGDVNLGVEDLRKTLAETYQLNFGINDKLVEQLAKQAVAAPGKIIRGQFPIARSTPPTPGENGRLTFSCLTDEETTRLPFAALQEAFGQSELEAVIAQHLSTCLVVPGQDLATAIPPTEGQKGKDIFGNISENPGKPVAVEAGLHVKRVADRFSAEIFGYLCLLEDKLSVLPPVWVAPDLMTAYFIYFPQEQDWPHPKIEWLEQGLTAKSVTHGIVQSCLENLSQQNIDAAEPAYFLLAEATQAVPGNDAYIKFAFNSAPKAGEILDDGSIDLKERNAATAAVVDQVLGEVVAATQGTLGTNIAGEEIATTDGEDHDFEAGENVRSETSEGKQCFIAEIDGVIVLKGDTLAVSEIFHVNGDVDYETGNIDVGKSVQISGCVRSGFSVKAGGSISIGALVEDGAQLNARGDITVSQGIVGESTRVVTLGNLESKFIQNSAVIARGNIVVGSYIFNAQVRAGGTIEVKSGGGERGGSIVGGEVFATKGIEARLLGSPTTSHTVVGIGANPETNARQKKLKKAIDYCDIHILRLLRTLGLREVQAERVKVLIQQTLPARRPFVIDAVKKLNELVTTREQTNKEREQLTKEIIGQLGSSQIKVTETAFAGVQIRFGEEDLTPSSDLAHTTFYRELGRVRQRQD